MQKGSSLYNIPVISQTEGEGFVSILLWYEFKDTYIPAQEGIRSAGLSSLYNKQSRE